MQADIITMRRLHQQQKRRQRRRLNDHAASHNLQARVLPGSAPASAQEQPSGAAAAGIHSSLLTPYKQPPRVAFPMFTPAPARPVQPQPASLLVDLFKLAAEIGWEVFKAEWERASPVSRKAWDMGANLATSPSITPIGQKIGIGLCSASLLARLDEMDEESDD